MAVLGCAHCRAGNPVTPLRRVLWPKASRSLTDHTMEAFLLDVQHDHSCFASQGLEGLLQRVDVVTPEGRQNAGWLQS
jgi:hypothetical protein